MFACWRPAVRWRRARSSRSACSRCSPRRRRRDRAAAEATLAAIPNESLAGFLGRSDVPEGLREFFRARGIEPVPGGDTSDEPLVDAEAAAGAVREGAEEDEDPQSITQKLALLGVADRMKAAMKGTKSERAILIRDPNKLVSAAVLSSPKLTDSEVENFAKLANVSEEVLRTIGMNRGVDQELRRGRGADEKSEDAARRVDAIRAAPERSRSEDDRAGSESSGAAQARRPQAHRRGPREKMIRMLSADDKLAEIKRLYYQTSRATIKAGLCQGDRSAEVDVDRGGKGEGRGLHGWPLADAIGLGKAGQVDTENEKRKRKNE